MDKQIIIDDYFTERTDEGRGTIGYYLIDDIALIKKIREQNKYIKAKEQECESLKKQLFSFMNGDYCANGCSLKQQFNQLKQEKDTLTMTREKLLDDLWITEESLKDYEAHYNRQCEQVDQLKQAEQKLEKIKEICKNVMPTGIDEETDKFGDILEIIEE